MRLGRAFALSGLIILLAGAAPAFAANPHSSLSLTMTGMILDSGTQSYYHTGGNLVVAVIGGSELTSASSVLHYALHATVSELTVSGTASFELNAVDAKGSHFVVSGEATIDGMVPAESFPLGCTTDCTSGIPGVFTGVATLEAQQCQGAEEAGHCVELLQETVPMIFESAFLNPFGGPIFMQSVDNAVYIESTYSQSRVIWTGIQLGGTILGSLAGSPVAGTFGMIVNATEDLRGGYELDHGTIAFSSSNPAVTALGTFVGRSTIPAGLPCDPSLGFPPGTCQITGFSSAGVFSQTNALGGSIGGTYTTQWTAPAVAFTSTVAATLK